MRRIFIRSIVFCLLLALGIGGYAFMRAYGLYQSTVGGFEHIRYLLESGESIEGAEAEDVLSDSYLLSLLATTPNWLTASKPWWIWAWRPMPTSSWAVYPQWS